MLNPVGAIWDVGTACVAIWYWSLRGRFPALVRGAAVFEDLRLRLSERRFRGIVETTGEGVVLIDGEGRVADLVLPLYREDVVEALAAVRDSSDG